jgi:dTDP-4-amino-4,6-dideoxygalactose transaminase
MDRKTGKVKPIKWENFPLPLIQVNPPGIDPTLNFLEKAYETGIFSNCAQLQREASSKMAGQVNKDLEGYLASSNTSALIVCLLEIGVRGRHVILSNFTFAATVQAVVTAGGIPIVCDIDQQTLAIDTKAVHRIIHCGLYDIAAVVPTRVFGFVNDMSELFEVCEASEVPVVVDSAACFPEKSGLWNFRIYPKFEVFSLHATKVFGVGEAGLIVGSRSSIEKVRQRANFGIVEDGSLQYRDGINAKADEFTAARVLARFSDYPKDVQTRYEFVEIYKEILSGDERIHILGEGVSPIYAYFPVIFESENMLLKFREIVSNFITTRRYYFPTINSGYIGDANIIFDADLQFSESISRRVLCLPVYISCTEEVKSEIKVLIGRALEQL